MKKVLSVSLVLMQLFFACTLKAQNLIENDDVKVLIPSELIPSNNAGNKSSWTFTSNELTFIVNEMKSEQSHGEYLSGWAKHIGNGNHFYYSTPIDGYSLSTVLFETTPDGILYNNEMIAFDNILYKSVFKNAAKIYSFMISYPKKDSLKHLPLVNKIKSSIHINHETVAITTAESPDAITIFVPSASFVDVYNEGCGIHTSFLQQLIFRKSALGIEQVMKEKKAFYKRTDTKGITVTEKDINGIKTFVMKGSSKNQYHKGLCNYETSYFYQIGKNTWSVDYSLSHNCKEPLDEARYVKILESIKYTPKQ